MSFGTKTTFANEEFKPRKNSVKYNKGPTDNILRLLPPMHSLADNPMGWRGARHTVIWGYYGVNEKNEEKPRARPFESVEKVKFIRGQKRPIILVEDPQIEKNKKYKALIKAKEAAIEKDNPGASEDELKDMIAEATEVERKYLADHNADTKWYTPAINEDNEPVLYKIGSLNMKSIQALFEKYVRDYKKNPLDLHEGVWINIHRPNRNGRDDTVTLVTEAREVEGIGTVQVPKTAPLTDEMIQRCLDEIPDPTLPVAEVLTVEQIRELTECNGEPEVVDAIMNATQRDEDDDYEEEGAPSAKTRAKVKKMAAPPPPAQEEMSEEDIDAELEARFSE